MFVSTNAIFLEDDYVTNFKPSSKVFLKELLDNVVAPQQIRIIEIREEEDITRPRQNITLPRCSERIVR